MFDMSIYFRYQNLPVQGKNPAKLNSPSSTPTAHENLSFQVQPLVAPYRSQVFDHRRDTQEASKPPVYIVDNEIRNNLNSVNALRSNQTQYGIRGCRREQDMPEINPSTNSVFNLPNVVLEDDNALQT